MRRLLRGALHQGARLLGTALAVALAVTLGSGTFILTDTVDGAFRKASRIELARPLAEAQAATAA